MNTGNTTTMTNAVMRIGLIGRGRRTKVVARYRSGPFSVHVVHQDERRVDVSRDSQTHRVGHRT
jgi:hypothetical protein